MRKSVKLRAVGLSCILRIRHWALGIGKPMPFAFCCLVFTFFVFPLHAQLVNDMEDESKLYAETKQVNQFFRRFNGEEDEKGERYYAKDKQFRSEKLRKKYLGILFDASNTGINSELITQFGKQVLD